MLQERTAQAVSSTNSCMYASNQVSVSMNPCKPQLRHWVTTDNSTIVSTTLPESPKAVGVLSPELSQHHHRRREELPFLNFESASRTHGNV